MHLGGVHRHHQDQSAAEFAGEAAAAPGHPAPLPPQGVEKSHEPPNCHETRALLHAR